MRRSGEVIRSRRVWGFTAFLLLTSPVSAFAGDCEEGSHGWWKRCAHFRDREFGDHHRRWQRDATDRSKRYGGETTFSGGQRGGFSSNSTNLGQLASSMGEIASRYEARSKEIAADQKRIADSSINSVPGPTNAEAQKFNQANQSGSSALANYKNSPDPVVKEQAEAYDKLGETRQAADAEAKKYRDREAQMKELAAKNDQNANKMDNKGAGGGGGSPPGGGGSPKGQSSGSPSTVADQKPLGDSLQKNAGLDKPRDASSSSTPEAGRTGGGKLVEVAPSRSPASVGNTAGGSPFGGGSGSLNDLRNALASKFASSSSVPNSSGASSPGGGGAGGGGGGSLSEKNSSGEGKATSSNGGSFTAGGGGDGGSGGFGDDLVSPFGKPLSDPKFNLPGSETDASVKGLINEFSGSEEQQAGLATLEAEGGIGDRDGPTLFERCHNRHISCAQKSCVKGSAGGKGEG